MVPGPAVGAGTRTRQGWRWLVGHVTTHDAGTSDAGRVRQDLAVPPRPGWGSGRSRRRGTRGARRRRAIAVEAPRLRAADSGIDRRAGRCPACGRPSRPGTADGRRRAPAGRRSRRRRRRPGSRSWARSPRIWPARWAWRPRTMVTTARRGAVTRCSPAATRAVRPAASASRCPAAARAPVPVLHRDQPAPPRRCAPSRTSFQRSADGHEVWPSAMSSRLRAAAVAACSPKGRRWATTTAGARAAATSATAFCPAWVTTTSAAHSSAHRSGEGRSGLRSVQSHPGGGPAGGLDGRRVGVPPARTPEEEHPPRPFPSRGWAGGRAGRRTATGHPRTRSCSSTTPATRGRAPRRATGRGGRRRGRRRRGASGRSARRGGRRPRRVCRTTGREVPLRRRRRPPPRPGVRGRPRTRASPSGHSGRGGAAAPSAAPPARRRRRSRPARGRRHARAGPSRPASQRASAGSSDRRPGCAGAPRWPRGA